MNISSYYYEVLSIKPGSNIEEVKKAYHKLVKKNHPDLFPDDQKHLQELKMIQIIEAYSRLTDEFKFDWNEIKDDSMGWEYKPSSPFEVGFHRDVEYAYYKQGFTNYSKALHGIKGIEKRSQLKTDWYYLRRFSNSLCYLRKADVYFSKILDEYPQSIWAYDAYIKVRRIEYFSRLYHKILMNIEKKLKTKRQKSLYGKI